MRSTLLTVALGVSALISTVSTLGSSPQLFDPSHMSGSRMVKFGSSAAKVSWKAFIRGWYSQAANQNSFIIDEQCFGDWMSNDIFEIDNLLA